MASMRARKLSLLAATTLVMSAMASSAWATDCKDNTGKDCPPVHTEGRGGGGGSDGQPLGEIIRRDTGTLMGHSGIDHANTNNGYTSAGRGSDSEAARNEKIKYDKAYTDAKLQALTPGMQGTGRVTTSFNAANDVILTVEFDFARPDGRGIDHVEDIRNMTQQNGHAIIHHYNFRDANGRNGENRPAKQGPGSLTYVNKDGTPVKTLKPSEAHVTGASGTAGKPGTGAANRAALRADPAKLAAAQAAAREAAKAPSAPHTPHPKSTATPPSPQKVSTSTATSSATSSATLAVQPKTPITQPQRPTSMQAPLASR